MLSEVEAQAQDERLQPGEVEIRVVGSALGRAPGAEVVGIVSAAGEAAGDWMGRRVLVPRVLPCGECERCRRGLVAHCPALPPRTQVVESERLPARFLCALEPPLWQEGAELWPLAALADAAAAPFAALMRLGVEPNQLVAIFGDDVRALFAAATARAKGAVPLLITDSTTAIALTRELEIATQSGGESLASFCEQKGLRPIAHRFVVTGGQQNFDRALSALTDGAAIALLDRLPVHAADLSALVTHEATLLGQEICHPDLYPELVALWVRGELPLLPLVERVKDPRMSSSSYPRLPVVAFD